MMNCDGWIKERLSGIRSRPVRRALEPAERGDGLTRTASQPFRKARPRESANPASERGAGRLPFVVAHEGCANGTPRQETRRGKRSARRFA